MPETARRRRRLAAGVLAASLRTAHAGSGFGERHVLRWADAGASSNLPHARGGAAVARFRVDDDDVLLLFGGCSEVACFDALIRHDVGTSAWYEQPVTGKPPNRRRGATANVLGAKPEHRLVVLGGADRSGGPLHDHALKYYDLPTRAWGVLSVAGDAPAARTGHTATSIDATRMVVFGGEGATPGSLLNDVHLFDASQDLWTELLPRGDGDDGKALPLGRAGHSCTKIGPALYCFGGYARDREPSRAPESARNELWVLDMKNGMDRTGWLRMWTIGRAPSPRAYHGAVAGGTNLFVVGGCDVYSGICYDDVHMLDTTYLEGMRWLRLPVGVQRYAPRQAFALWASAGRLYLQGGCRPPMASVRQEEHCYADAWALEARRPSSAYPCPSTPSHLSHAPLLPYASTGGRPPRRRQVAQRLLERHGRRVGRGGGRRRRQPARRGGARADGEEKRHLLLPLAAADAAAAVGAAVARPQLHGQRDGRRRQRERRQRHGRLRGGGGDGGGAAGGGGGGRL